MATQSVSKPSSDEGGTPRQRYRAQIRAEIKQAALSQLAESGPAGLSVNAIGKELGLTGPALYRYFASRDDLLTELVMDAYADLAAALRAAVDAAPQRPPRRRLEALGHAYRAWALAQPHRYRLLYGPPLPGYEAHADQLVEASRAAMDILIETLPSPAEDGPPTRSLAAQARRWADRQHLAADASKAILAMLAWSRVHGFVTLEIAGNYDSMGVDADALFEIELSAIG